MTTLPPTTPAAEALTKFADALLLTLTAAKTSPEPLSNVNPVTAVSLMFDAEKRGQEAGEFFAAAEDKSEALRAVVHSLYAEFHVCMSAAASVAAFVALASGDVPVEDTLRGLIFAAKVADHG